MPKPNRYALGAVFLSVLLAFVLIWMVLRPTSAPVVVRLTQQSVTPEVGQRIEMFADYEVKEDLQLASRSKLTVLVLDEPPASEAAEFNVLQKNWQKIWDDSQAFSPSARAPQGGYRARTLSEPVTPIQNDAYQTGKALVVLVGQLRFASGKDSGSGVVEWCHYTRGNGVMNLCGDHNGLLR